MKFILIWVVANISDGKFDDATGAYAHTPLYQLGLEYESRSACNERLVELYTESDHLLGYTLKRSVGEYANGQSFEVVRAFKKESSSAGLFRTFRQVECIEIANPSYKTK